MTKRRNALIAVAALWWAGSAFAIEAKDLKRALDGGGNWLIEQFDLKEKVFGKGERAKDVTTVAMCVKALCDNPRDYKETSGPFISEPVKYILSQIGEDGKLKGANAADVVADAWVIAALEATMNETYAGIVAKCLVAMPAGSGARQDEQARLKLDVATLRVQLAAQSALPKEVRAALPKWQTNIVVYNNDKEARKRERYEATAVAILKVQQKSGAFSEDIKVHAACLIELNGCYKALK